MMKAGNNVYDFTLSSTMNKAVDYVYCPLSNDGHGIRLSSEICSLLTNKHNLKSTCFYD